MATKVIPIEILVQQNIVHSVTVLLTQGEKGDSGIVLNWITLSQAEFDALSQPEKDDFSIMYNIVLPLELIFTVQTDNTGLSDDDQFIIFAIGGPYSIKWDDGSEDTGLSGSFTKTFAGGAGTYIGAMTSDDATPFQPFQFNTNDARDKQKLILISQWGISIPWSNAFAAFYGCVNLAITANDAPNTTLVSTYSRFFRGCTSLTLLDVTDWDTSSVTNMSDMFRGNAPLTDIIDFENLDFSGVTNMNRMLTSVTLPTTRYSDFLINLESASHQSNVILTGGSSKYSAGAAATARAALISDGWTITDGGQE